MKWILGLLFVAFPFSTQADPKDRVKDFNYPPTYDRTRHIVKLHLDQQTLIRMADQHYNEAIVELEKALKISWYVLDLGKRKHLETLIVGAIQSAQAKGPRQKILSIGLALIGGLVLTAIDKYNGLQTLLVKIEHHFEMADFYNMASLTLKKRKHTDEGTKLFLEGIDYLTYAIVLLEGIHPSFECILQSKNFSHAFISYRSQFMANQHNLGDQGWALYEDSSKIMAKCEHDDIKRKVTEAIYQMALKFREADNAWKNRKKK